MMQRLFFVFVLLNTLVLSACNHVVTVENTPPENAPIDGRVSESDAYQLSRYDVASDFSPDKILVPHEIKDAEPKIEARSRGGNYSPYDVFGKTYEVMSDEQASQYKGSGGASWYGLKFHGHKTSNGEIYDIYAMTAAHKTLPIPSYVRVTNLQNNRSCIVRVNDRGPFHEGRIIDLSYAAATKLGYIGQGTAQVSVEAINTLNVLAHKPLVTVEREIYLQVGAYSQESIAKEKYQTLYAKFSHPVFLEAGIDQFYRIKIGPVSEPQLAQIQLDLASEGYPAPVRSKRLSKQVEKKAVQL